MSTLSSDDHLSPQNPLYYAPRRLREKSQSSSNSFAETKIDRLKRLASTSTPPAFDTMLEDAVAQALRHPLDPEVVPEPHEFSGERDQRKSVLRVVSLSAAAIGVAAGAALVFVVLVPVSQDHARQSDNLTSIAGIMNSVKAALSPSRQKDEDAMPDVSEFQTILASSRAEQPVTHEQSETLLQQFLQWQKKPTQTP